MTIAELNAPLFLFILMLVGTIGFIAQFIGLCMVRGVREAATGKPVFLLAIVLSGSLAWIPALVAPLAGIQPLYEASAISLYAIIGGLLFGAGAAFNGGCSVSTIGRLTRGEIVMFLTVLGWIIGWFIEGYFVPSVQYPKYPVPANVQYSILILLTITLGVLLLTAQRRNSKVWLSMLAIGLIGGILLLFESGWTPSGLLKDISSAVFGGSGTDWPGIERYVLVLALIVGMIFAAFTTRRFELRAISLRGIGRHLLAGTLMGIGGSMAAGGNDTQLLSALPSVSPAGIATVGAMIIGIYLVNSLSQGHNW